MIAGEVGVYRSGSDKNKEKIMTIPCQSVTYSEPSTWVRDSPLHELFDLVADSIIVHQTTT